MLTTYLIYGFVIAIILFLFWFWGLPILQKGYRVFPKDYHEDKPEFYIGYSYTHLNQPDVVDYGIWHMTAANPDAACHMFLQQCELYSVKIMCCTLDYGYACARLLKP